MTLLTKLVTNSAGSSTVFYVPSAELGLLLSWWRNKSAPQAFS